MPPLPYLNVGIIHAPNFFKVPFFMFSIVFRATGFPQLNVQRFGL